MTFTIGCDPEIFLTQDGKPVSAYGLIPGDKEKPFPVPGGAIQVDGTAVEFNTDPVSLGSVESFNLFNEKIVLVTKALKKEVEKAGKYNFNYSPVQEYPEEYLKSLPEKATELGCDPDYCAYTLEVNPRPDGDRPFRTGAGHIHIGWGEGIPIDNREHHEICASFVKMLDATVGLFMVCIDRDNRRRELYGKAGAYRAKSYGVEYRYPSNVWLSSKALRKCVYDLCVVAVSYMQLGYTPKRVCGLTEEELEKVLNTGDVSTAETSLLRMGQPTINQYLKSAEYQAI